MNNTFWQCNVRLRMSLLSIKVFSSTVLSCFSVLSLYALISAKRWFNLSWDYCATQVWFYVAQREKRDLRQHKKQSYISTRTSGMSPSSPLPMRLTAVTCSCTGRLLVLAYWRLRAPAAEQEDIESLWRPWSGHAVLVAVPIRHNLSGKLLNDYSFCFQK